MSTINEEIQKIKQDFKRLQNVPDEKILPLLAYKYIYLTDPDDLKYSDYKTIVVDGPNDGGIDAIFEHPESSKMVIIQSKHYKEIGTKDVILNAFKKIETTIKDLKNQQTANYRKEVATAWVNCYDPDDPIDVVFLSSASVSDSIISNVKEMLEKEDISFHPIIYTKEDLEEQIANSDNIDPWVEHGALEVDKNNICKCPNNENGIILNITAKSLKTLYHQNPFRLFQQNFRYYIKQKDVDNKIQNSILKESSLFWFLNNGIIIACEDYRVDGDQLRLDRFSVINGCQTTYLIGNTNFDDDFYITCKIVKADSPETQDQFVGNIAAASNRQKAITPKDLRSTDKSLQQLQKELRKDPDSIFLEIRRGEPHPRNIEKLKNELYGQLIMSFFLQQPAKARNSKKVMFESDNLYKEIFQRRNFDKKTIVDLIYLYNKFKEYKEKQLENEAFSIPEETMIKYIHFFILGIVGLIIKIKRGLFDIKKHPIKDFSSEGTWEKELYADNISGPFINRDIDDFDVILEGFFYQILQDLIGIFKNNPSIGTQANFTKVTEHYTRLVVPDMIKKFFILEYDKKQRANFLKLFH